MFSFLSCRLLGVGFLGCMVNHWSFKKNSKLFSKVFLPSHQQWMRGPISPHPHQHLIMFVLFQFEPAPFKNIRRKHYLDGVIEVAAKFYERFNNSHQMTFTYLFITAFPQIYLKCILMAGFSVKQDRKCHPHMLLKKATEHRVLRFRCLGQSPAVATDKGHTGVIKSGPCMCKWQRTETASAVMGTLRGPVSAGGWCLKWEAGFSFPSKTFCQVREARSKTLHII